MRRTLGFPCLRRLRLLPPDFGPLWSSASPNCVADLDAILSWNFRDMVNIRKKSIVHTVNAKYGYRLIDIISPLEVPRE